ncbi:MAG: ABC transporter permease subunit [Bdellovibrionota bacterium]|nr:ABC transporter permease subunit [Bdellovibrionota bacterium]
MRNKVFNFVKEIFNHRGASIGLLIISTFFLLAFLAPLIANHDPSLIYENNLKTPPFWSENGSFDFILGTDDLGRDIFSRIVFGSRISIIIGFCVVIISLTLGTFLGLIAGYYGGKLDRIIMRSIDILMSFPSILLAIVVVAVLGPGVKNAIFAVSVVSIPAFTRIVRSSVLVEKEKEYTVASQAFGASSFRTLFIEIFPNCLAPLIVQGSLSFSDAILNAAALSFLGLGAQPPLAEWGIMLSDAKPFIESAPWMTTSPGCCILLIVLGFNLFGDGLRDILDPKLKN